jgi:hypothetical protein
LFAVFTLASVALLAGTVVTGGIAQAATPSASLSFASSSVKPGTQPVISYHTSGLPAGSDIILQRASGSGQGWQNVGLIQGGNGTVKAPADAAGQYRYRLAIAEGNTMVATSAPSSLKVTAAGTSGSDNCTICKMAKAVLPVLAPVVVPAVGDAIGEVILTILGFLFG